MVVELQVHGMKKDGHGYKPVYPEVVQVVPGPTLHGDSKLSLLRSLSDGSERMTQRLA